MDTSLEHHPLKQEIYVTDCLEKMERFNEGEADRLGKELSQMMERCMEDCTLYEEV
jgi:hypothetical protein